MKPLGPSADIQRRVYRVAAAQANMLPQISKKKVEKPVNCWDSEEAKTELKVGREMIKRLLLEVY